jgi:alkylated DNA nucleotide flippase Atl1
VSFGTVHTPPDRGFSHGLPTVAESSRSELIAPRFAGTVLHATSDPDVPWHRVVRADGSLAKGSRQRRLLVEEGIPFRGDRVDMRAARLPD